MIPLLICAAAAAVILIVYLFLVAPRRPRRYLLPARGYAHRGLWNGDMPENSLAAFRAAVDKKFAVETDVQLTSDGVPVIMHDNTLLRMCGVNKKVGECTLAELDGYRLGGTDEKIPTLDELLSTLDGKVPLLLELKGETTDVTLCDVIAPVLAAYRGEFVIESFNPLLLGRMRTLKPEIVRGQLVTCPNRRHFPGNKLLNFALGAMLTNFLSRPDFIAYDLEFPRGVSLSLTTGLYGARRCVWTVRTRAQYERALAMKECPIFEEILPE